MQDLKLFHDIADHPFDYARTWKKSHHRNIIGYFCSYTPEEIIFAAEALPFRIFGSGDTTALSDEHLQTYCCSFARSALADGLCGKLNFLDGTVFPHTCDTIQRLSDIWRINLDYGFHTDIGLPVKLNSDSAREYLIRVLQKFRHELEKHLGVTISNDHLIHAAGKYNRLRSLMKQLFDLRQKNPQILNSADLHAIVKSAMIMDRDDFLEKIAHVINKLTSQPPQQRSGLKRLVLAGGMCNMPDVSTIIEGCDAAVIWDDSCSGDRYFEGEIDLSGDVITAIADRYAEKIVCPAKHADLYSRGEHLARIAKAYNANGVVFVILKFCDPHAFDYPYIKELLDKKKIPSMLLEIEIPLPSEGQLRTRCEAFLEMI